MTLSGHGEVESGGLWRGLRRAEASAREELFAKVREVCPAVFRQRGVGAEEAEDLLHEVFLSTCDFVERHEEAPRDWRGFLKWRARGVFSQYARTRARGGKPLPTDGLEAQGDRPWSTMVREELQQALSGCVSALVPKQRRVWDLRERGLGTADISDALAMPYGTVGTLVYRAQRALWGLLEEEGGPWLSPTARTSHGSSTTWTVD